MGVCGVAQMPALLGQPGASSGALLRPQLLCIGLSDSLVLLAAVQCDEGKQGGHKLVFIDTYQVVAAY